MKTKITTQTQGWRKPTIAITFETRREAVLFKAIVQTVNSRDAKTFIPGVSPEEAHVARVIWQEILHSAGGALKFGDDIGPSQDDDDKIYP